MTKAAKERYTISKQEFDELQSYLDNLDFFQSIKDNLREMKKGWVGVFDDIKKAIDKAIDSIDVFLGKAHIASSGNVHGGGGRRYNSIPQFASGGFVRSADVFMANENGIPELVGTVGGRTAVASGTEITGISDAVYDTGSTQAQLLSAAVNLLQVIANKDFGASDDYIFNSFRRSAEDYTNRTGNPAIPI